MKQQAYIFDIDGTLANCAHRLHFIQQTTPDWDTFYATCNQDKLIESVGNVAQTLMQHTDYQIILITGRPADATNNLTQDWLWIYLEWAIDDYEMYMRKTGDHRPDYQVKRDIYEQHIKDKYEILGVFEDRQQCVDMWRSLGLTCFQVAKGDY